jgi:hypothetical protein
MDCSTIEWLKPMALLVFAATAFPADQLSGIALPGFEIPATQ